jgi:hypothetical protein
MNYENLQYKFVEYLQKIAISQPIDKSKFVCTNCSVKSGKFIFVNVDLDDIKHHFYFLRDRECAVEDYFIKKCCPNCKAAYKITVEGKSYFASKIVRA